MFRNKRLKEIINTYYVLFGFNIGICCLKYFGIVEYDKIWFGGAITVTMFYFSIAYIPLLFSWQSYYLTKLILMQVNFKSYIFSRWVFINITPLIAAFVLSLIYAFFFQKLIISIWSIYLFNIGIMIPVTFFASFGNKDRIILNKIRKLNFQGLSFMHFLLTPLLFIIFIILGILSSIYVHSFFLAPAIMGVLGLLLTPRILIYFTNRFNEDRYKLIKNFHND